MLSNVTAFMFSDEPLYVEVDQEVPIVVNVGRRGYFRQNYDTAGWQKIIEQFKKDHKVRQFCTVYAFGN